MNIKLASNEVIHFIGIGGIGMSGLALVMKNMGFKVFVITNQPDIGNKLIKKKLLKRCIEF